MFETVLALMGVCLAGQMSPGPDMMLLVRHAATGSRRSAVGCALGVCAGLCFHIAFAILGLAVLIKATPWIFHAIRYAGAAYLIYIGIMSLRDSGSLNLQNASSCGLGSLTGGFLQGLACNLLNPKVTLFMLSLFTQFISPDTALPDKLVYGTAILAESLLGWLLFVYLLDTRPLRRLYANHMHHINRFSGMVFLLLGCAVVFAG